MPKYGTACITQGYETPRLHCSSGDVECQIKKMWNELILDVHGVLHLSLRQTWQEVHVSVGLV